MADREQALEVADAIIADARRQDADRRSGLLRFNYAGTLTREEIEEFSADPQRLRASFAYAHRQWRLRLATLALPLLVGAAVGLELAMPLVCVLFICIMIAIRALNRKLVLEYYEARASGDGVRPDGETTPPPPA